MTGSGNEGVSFGDGEGPENPTFGVDEAGKGPVLGSMFAAAVAGDPDDLPEGVVDSKRLPPERRETLAAEIRDAMRVGVAEIPVKRIDAPDTDMNALTVAAHAEALSQVASDESAHDGALAGHVDAGDVDEARFARRVTDGVDADVSVTAEHGADDTYDLVAAASVVAKVARDSHVDALADDYPGYDDLGSGYPSDPTTRDFLEAYVADNGRLPECARESWQTSQDALAAAEQSGLGEF